MYAARLTGHVDAAHDAQEDGARVGRQVPLQVARQPAEVQRAVRIHDAAHPRAALGVRHLHNDIY